jgi:two-component system, LuxR family, response regulator FixJ
MTVTLIEDDEAALHSLHVLLEARGYDVRCFPSAEAFLGAAGQYAPTCIVSDVRMPGMSGLDLHRQLKGQGSIVPVILITGHGDIAMAVAAIKEGAFDFIEKPYNADQLIASIDKAIAAEHEQRGRDREAAELIERVAELSPRQREVMHLVAQGQSNKQIALRLGISPRTVENYRAWVMERMGAANVAELVRKVMMVEQAADGR